MLTPCHPLHGMNFLTHRLTVSHDRRNRRSSSHAAFVEGAIRKQVLLQCRLSLRVRNVLWQRGLYSKCPLLALHATRETKHPRTSYWA